jgi:glycine cleavage system H lipoate-binding protein
MTCPFLRETQVKYCQTAAVRTLIPLAQAASAQEKCSSGAHEACPMFRDQKASAPDTGAATCPFLRESLMQYCSAAPVTKFIPYSEALMSRCGSDNHRYCELYEAMAHPGSSAEPADELPMPPWLLYSANHMWLDLTDDGPCHAGIDAFLSRVLGKIDAITYLRPKGRQRPAAVLTASGLDLEVVFPNPFEVTACNLYLRADPARIAVEPYTGGWLFEGKAETGITANLLSGAAAHEWMLEEQRRLNEYLQQCAGVFADGGLFAANLAARLDHGQMRTLFHQFFSPYASETREP